MEIKYLVFPGAVTSKSDGDRHFITGNQLLKLYGVNWRDSIIVNTGLEITSFHGRVKKLEPKFDGDYNIENIEWEDVHYG